MISFLAVIREDGIGKVLRVRHCDIRRMWSQKTASGGHVIGDFADSDADRAMRARRGSDTPGTEASMKRKNARNTSTTIASIAPLSICFDWVGECLPKASPTHVEFNEVDRGLCRALGLRPWMPSPFDFECTVMEAKLYPSHANFAAVQELHRRLVAAA